MTNDRALELAEHELHALRQRATGIRREELREILTQLSKLRVELRAARDDIPRQTGISKWVADDLDYHSNDGA